MSQEEFIKYLVNILIYPDKFKIEDKIQSFYKNNKLYFEYEMENDILWVSNKYVWSIIRKEYNINFESISDLLKQVLIKHFKMDKTAIYCG